MDIPDDKTLLSFYRAYFGEDESRLVEIIPLPQKGDTSPKHIEFGSVQHLSQVPDKEELMQYVHPCWCNAELIYCDDTRNNEVWEHKLAQ